MATKEERVLMCPRCGSTKIIPHKDHEETKHGDPLEAYYSMRVCEDCKYTGYFFPDVPVKKLDAIRKEIKRMKK
jgi:hypothetical protein